MSKETKGRPDARFTALFRRALFELRLASDIARTDGYDSQTRALVAGAKETVRRACGAWQGVTSRVRRPGDRRR